LAGALCCKSVRFISEIVAAFPATCQQRDSTLCESEIKAMTNQFEFNCPSATGYSASDREPSTRVQSLSARHQHLSTARWPLFPACGSRPGTQALIGESSRDLILRPFVRNSTPRLQRPSGISKKLLKCAAGQWILSSMRLTLRDDNVPDAVPSRGRQMSNAASPQGLVAAVGHIHGRSVVRRLVVSVVLPFDPVLFLSFTVTTIVIQVEGAGSSS
jgi:hypothetical protein